MFTDIVRYDDFICSCKTLVVASVATSQTSLQHGSLQKKEIPFLIYHERNLFLLCALINSITIIVRQLQNMITLQIPIGTQSSFYRAVQIIMVRFSSFLQEMFFGIT